MKLSTIKQEKHEVLTPTKGYKNLIINGGFDVWQRGDFTANFGYKADRWLVNNSGTLGTVSKQETISFGTLLKGIGVDITTADDNFRIGQLIENPSKLMTKTFTLSYIVSGTATVIVIGYRTKLVDGAIDVYTTVDTVNPTSSKTKYSTTFTIPIPAGHTIQSEDPSDYIEFYFLNPNSELFNMQLFSVQLEEGSVATPFEQRPIGLELSLCQRYYQKDIGFNTMWSADATNSNTYYQPVLFKTSMRNTPTITLSDLATAGFNNPTSGNASTEGFRLVATCNATAATRYFRAGYTADAEL